MFLDLIGRIEGPIEGFFLLLFSTKKNKRRRKKMKNLTKKEGELLGKFMKALNKMLKEKASCLFDGGFANTGKYQGDPEDADKIGYYFEKFVGHCIGTLLKAKPGEISKNPEFPNMVWIKEPYGRDTFPDFGLMFVRNGEEIDWRLNGKSPAIAIDAKATTREKKKEKKTILCLGSANSFGKVNRVRFSNIFILLAEYDPILDDNDIVVDAVQDDNGYIVKPTIKNQKFGFFEESRIMSLTISDQTARSVPFKGMRTLEYLVSDDIKHREGDAWCSVTPLRDAPEFLELGMELGSVVLKKGVKATTVQEKAAQTYQKTYKKSLKKKETIERNLWDVISLFAKNRAIEAYIREQEELGFHSYDNLWEEVLKTSSNFTSISDEEQTELRKLHQKWKRRRTNRENCPSC